MSMKIKPEAVTIFHLWEDEEALKEMAGYVPPGSLQDDLLERAENLSRNGGIS